MIRSNRINYDNTPIEPKVIGICWYTPETYGPCLAVFDDRDHLHQSYDAWLKSAMEAESGLVQRGVRVVRVQIEPETFVQWCRDNGMEHTDRKARTIYAGIVALDSINDA